jgi:chemotaxis-related protein WspB
MLCLLFCIGDDRYALDTSQIAVVLPPTTCKQVPEAPPWVRGLIHYQGHNVPVLDISMLALGLPAAARLSTRLVLTHYVPSAAAEQAPQLLGLLVEKATETLQCEATDFTSSGLVHEDAPYLGPVLEREGQLIQWVQVVDLLDETVQALLFPQVSQA